MTRLSFVNKLTGLALILLASMRPSIEVSGRLGTLNGITRAHTRTLPVMPACPIQLSCWPIELKGAAPQLISEKETLPYDLRMQPPSWIERSCTCVRRRDCDRNARQLSDPVLPWMSQGRQCCCRSSSRCCCCYRFLLLQPLFLLLLLPLQLLLLRLLPFLFLLLSLLLQLLLFLLLLFLLLFLSLLLLTLLPFTLLCHRCRANSSGCRCTSSSCFCWYDFYSSCCGCRFSSYGCRWHSS